MEDSNKPFSLSLLLKKAGVTEETDLKSCEFFLQYFEVTENLLSQVTKEELEKWESKFDAKLREDESLKKEFYEFVGKEVRFVLGATAGAIAKAASEWSKKELTREFSGLSIVGYTSLLMQLKIKYGQLIVIPKRLSTDESSLGVFTKADYPLPYREGHLDMRLDRFTNVEEMLPSAHIILEHLKTLPLIQTSRKLFSIIGGSGYGKTTALMEVGFHHFLIFFKCGIAGGADAEEHFLQEGWSDSNFINMVNLIDIEFVNKDKDIATINASTIFLRQLTSRIILLCIMFNFKPSLLPEDFLMFQLDGGRFVIEQISNNLRNVEHKEIFSLLNEAFLDLYNTHLNGRRIICTFDEANVGYEWACKGKFKSPNGNPRGLLTNILQTFATTSLGLSILLAGTYWTLGQLENVESDIGDKYGKIDRPLTVFKVNAESDVLQYFSSRIHVDDCDIKSFPNFEYLIGRGRFCSKVIELIPNILKNNPSISKKKTIKKAITESVKLHRESLIKNIEQVWRKPNGPDILYRIFVGSIFGQYFIFSGNDSSQFDPIHLGLSTLVQINNNQVHWKIVEKIVIEAVREVISRKVSPTHAILYTHLQLLENALEKFGSTIQFKGNLLERIMSAYFLTNSLQNVPICDLPFVKSANLTSLPLWCKEIRWIVRTVCTPDSLGIIENTNLKSESDIRALASEGAILKCLYLKQVLGPEFLVRLGPEGEYWVSIGIKLYSKQVPSSTATENFQITTYASMKKRCPFALQKLFTSIPFKAILRIVINFPFASKKKSLCSKVEQQDVLLSIDQTNARTFFSTLEKSEDSIIAILAECTETDPNQWK